MNNNYNNINKNINKYISRRTSSFDIELKNINPLSIKYELDISNNNNNNNNKIINNIIDNSNNLNNEIINNAINIIDISNNLDNNNLDNNVNNIIFSGIVESDNIIHYDNILKREYSFFNCFSRKYYNKNQSKIKIIRKCLYPTILFTFLLFIKDVRNIIYIPFIFAYVSLIFFWNNPSLLIIPVKKPLYINEIFDYKINNNINNSNNISDYNNTKNDNNSLSSSTNSLENMEVIKYNNNNNVNNVNVNVNDIINIDINNNNEINKLQKILINIYLREKYSKILKWSLIITHSITISILSDFWFYKTYKINNIIEIFGISGGIIKILQIINKIISSLLLKIIFYFLKKEYKKQKKKYLCNNTNNTINTNIIKSKL